jgi:hypothetical protein
MKIEIQDSEKTEKVVKYFFWKSERLIVENKYLRGRVEELKKELKESDIAFKKMEMGESFLIRLIRGFSK